MEVIQHEEEPPSDSGRVSGTLGLISFLLLASSFVWAHHWGPLAFAIVVGWAVTTLLALVFGVRTLRRRGPERKLAWLGFVLGLASVFVLLSTAAAYAAGYDPVGACGGG
jgi:hypothetical protein